MEISSPTPAWICFHAAVIQTCCCLCQVPCLARQDQQDSPCPGEAVPEVLAAVLPTAVLLVAGHLQPKGKVTSLWSPWAHPPLERPCPNRCPALERLPYPALVEALEHVYCSCHSSPGMEEGQALAVVVQAMVLQAEEAQEVAQVGILPARRLERMWARLLPGAVQPNPWHTLLAAACPGVRLPVASAPWQRQLHLLPSVPLAPAQAGRVVGLR
mmetsp:Transcript_34751/g.63486  ORF Transcript_34751/g.63486 Transcript_34751/m.63486 type:complete len:214 (-) Transcript_34751:1940-2581(-)